MSNTTYNATCPSCHNNRTLTYKPKPDTQCKLCSSIEIVKVIKSRPRKYHWYFCHTCPSVRQLKAKRKSNYCQKCSKKASKQQKEGIYFDMEDMIIVKPRYFRICPSCPEDDNIIQVTSRQNSGYKQCKACANKKYQATRTKTTKPKKKKKVYKQIGIDGKQKVNIRNRPGLQSIMIDFDEDGEPIEYKDTYKIPKTDKEEDDAMIAEFLKKRRDK